MIAAVGLVGASTSVQATAELDASAFVQKLGDQTIALLTNDDYSDEDRTARYRELLREGFAVRTIGRFALGRYWHRASPEIRKEYLILFEEFAIDIYSKRLNSFSGENFRIIDSNAIDKTDTMVITEISGGDGPAIRVDYRVRSRNGKLQIIDVLVEGISLIVTQRSEFASVISRDGIEGLMDRLREYTKDN